MSLYQDEPTTEEEDQSNPVLDWGNPKELVGSLGAYPFMYHVPLLHMMVP